MRSPFRAVRRLPGARRAGAAVRACIENFIDTDISASKLTDLLGSGAAADGNSPEGQWLSARLSKLRASLMDALGAVPSGRTAAAYVSWDAELAQAYSIAAEDPDVEFIRWLWEGCPAGVAQEVAFGGIFPKIDASESVADDLEAAMTDQAPWGNYSS
eukprot:2740219-Heterocapsa_arctica.AAC.1